MSRTLQLPVLGLNSNWVVCDTYIAEKALGMLYSGAATAINLDEGYMVPTKWEDWVKLPIGETDDFVRTLHGRVRLPRVVIAVNYRQLKPRKLKLNNKNLAKVFGNKCGYTGEHVPIKDASLDHYIPKSKGGKTSWDNSVYTSKALNNRKGDKTAAEAGLKLQKKPIKDPVLMPADKVLMDHGIRFKEWGNFLSPE